MNASIQNIRQHINTTLDRIELVNGLIESAQKRPTPVNLLLIDRLELRQQMVNELFHLLAQLGIAQSANSPLSAAA